jgi:hypothetical protein
MPCRSAAIFAKREASEAIARLKAFQEHNAELQRLLALARPPGGDGNGVDRGVQTSSGVALPRFRAAVRKVVSLPEFRVRV